MKTEDEIRNLLATASEALHICSEKEWDIDLMVGTVSLVYTLRWVLNPLHGVEELIQQIQMELNATARAAGTEQALFGGVNHE